jgi:hypothetical protein
MAARKGIPAAAFMATFSSAGHIAEPRTCCNCQTAARWNSIYCSDACEREFLTFPEYNDEFSSKEIN